MAAGTLPALAQRTLKGSASAPVLRVTSKPQQRQLFVRSGSVEEVIDEEEAVPRASWLPALRPLTGCAGCGGFDRMDVSLSTTARSCGVQSLASQLADEQSFGAHSLSPTRFSSKQALVRSTSGQLDSARVAWSARDGSVADTRLRSSCISPDAKWQNERSRGSLRALAGTRGAATDMVATKSLKPEPLVDFHEFGRSTERLEKTLAGLKLSHDAFDPREAKLPGSPQGATNKGATGKAPSDEEVERRAERLEAYKMARRLEPELPPLPRHLETNLPPRPPPDQAIVERNASGASVVAHSKDAKMARLENQRLERANKREAVASQRSLQHEASAETFAQGLAKKRQQADAAIVAQQSKLFNLPSNTTLFAKRWLTMMAATSMLHTIQKKVEAKRAGEIIVARISMRDAVGILQRPEDKQETTQKLKLVACMYKLRYQVAQARKDAKMIFSSLSRWKTGGRFCVGLVAMSKAVYKLQAWWRVCRKRLKEARDNVSARWEQLEQQSLVRQHLTQIREAKRQAVAEEGGRRVAVPGVNVDTIPLEARLVFIEHELRARRYFLLPQLDFWAEEARRFQEEMKSANLRREAYKFLEIEMDRPNVFRWPPTRPSYSPPKHPRAEGKGRPCAESCCGRKGDAEIMEMIQRARLHRDAADGHGGWKQIPQRAPGAQGSQASTKGPAFRKGNARRGAKGGRGKEDDSAFGDVEVTEAVLKDLGMDGKDMPGLADSLAATRGSM